ncbi:MAG TPA: aminotransferase class IV [Thermoanaerobaculia bacterium]|nr:aminotransferase class IV [Thermoanaerobaculia bacterium]
MSDPLYINGRFTTTDERIIGAEDRGLQFGDGVYEVLKFKSRTPLFANTHFVRFERGLTALGIEIPWNLTTFTSLCSELISRGSIEEGIVYFQVTRGEGERTHLFPEGMKPTAIAYTRRMPFPDAEKKASGIRAISFDDLRWRLCHIKSTNLLGSVLAKQKARESGAVEALLHDGGEIREGANSSFFAVREDTLLTHPLTERILPGTVREKVLMLARDAGIWVEERPIRLDELRELDEAFMTSTTQAVMPIIDIDGHAVSNGKRGILTERLQRLFDDLELKEFV